MMDVEYKITTRKTPLRLGLNFVLGKNHHDPPWVRAYISNIWHIRGDFHEFVRELVFVWLLERICLERYFNRLRMKNRCQPVCKPSIVARLMLDEDDGEAREEILYTRVLEQV